MTRYRLGWAAALVITFGAPLAHRGVAQSPKPRLHLEATAGLLIPTRALYAGEWGSTRLQTAPVLSVAGAIMRPSGIGLRARGVAALTGVRFPP
jgi:hypothetical protein